MPNEFVLLFGVDENLFKLCFVKDEDWSPCKLLSIEEECDTNELRARLETPGICSVVIQSMDLPPHHLQALKHFFDIGGLVAFFGIFGDFEDPKRLCRAFGLNEKWRFSAYTNSEYELTGVAHDSLGYSISTQQYTKSNLLSVPVQDRWMVAKAQPLHMFIEDMAWTLTDGEEPDEEWLAEAKAAKEQYVQYCEGEYEKCPLAVHQNQNGGKLAYLGFVNGDGNIPRIVKALLTRKEIPA